MKEVLISIQPKWIEKICNQIGVRNGEPIYEKRIEVRKSRPKLETPFKVRIYCTKGDLIIYGNGKQYITDSLEFLKGSAVEAFENSSGFRKWNGKVIGEFVCKGIMRPYDSLKLMAKQSCLTEDELLEYSNGKTLYGWRIADLKIYDKPKELSEFRAECRNAYFQDGDCYCKDGYGSCAIRDREKEYPYNEECIYFDCPSCGGESCEYEDFAYCLCNGRKPITRPPQSWCYVEEVK